LYIWALGPFSGLWAGLSGAAERVYLGPRRPLWRNGCQLSIAQSAGCACRAGLYSYRAGTGGQGDIARTITSLCDVALSLQEQSRILAQMADVAVSIVSLTVTEKGYCQRDGTH
tara:strand:- start:655 stop:996 length:342 start_codon:yes stop_codon:yes gene_type:complete